MQPATLCYPVRNERVLLIRKKRGLGAGKFVGPGGKVEDGETPREAAVREVEEEIRVSVTDPTKVGEFEFVFGVRESAALGNSLELRSDGDDTRMFVHVFRAEEFAGTPEETAEAVPRWFDFEDVPYDEMWEDDRLWMPHLFSGETFAGRFRFDAEGETLVEHDLTVGVEF
ncbi:8-oxo-dGTP diphosphatase [Haladaptatus salinisoli]|uniref:8-oxo-dGTP diphosphatase n=1 Tax=Haladaptatus salinisoli TaxID=2884876 RepID=UPI001D0B9422|nr:8-oxo-dGTP diphosphatase [Haladaptatus salinisoli]